MGAALSSKSRSGPRLVLQPAGRRTARHSTRSALKRFFEIADAWELSPLQQCRLLKIPSPQVLARYRLGQAPRLSAVQQERAALVANIHHSLAADKKGKNRASQDRTGQDRAGQDRAGQDRAWAWVHAPQAAVPFNGDSPLYFMLENGLPALREVARLLVRESAPR
jgi:hypothetical protein